MASISICAAIFGAIAASFRPDAPENRHFDNGKAKQVERGAADAILIDLEPMPRGFVWREAQRHKLCPRRLELRLLALKGDRPFLPYRAETDALAGQPLVGIFGPQAKPIFGGVR